MHSGIGGGLFAVCIVFGVVKLCLQSNVYVEFGSLSWILLFRERLGFYKAGSHFSISHQIINHIGTLCKSIGWEH